MFVFPPKWRNYVWTSFQNKVFRWLLGLVWCFAQTRTHMHKYLHTNICTIYFKMIILDSCSVLCTTYTIYFQTWFFLDSCLVLCECCGQFEGLASCVESPLTSSSPSNTYKIIQLFFCTNTMSLSHKHRAAVSPPTLCSQ